VTTDLLDDQPNQIEAEACPVGLEGGHVVSPVGLFCRKRGVGRAPRPARGDGPS
jgi:hypothetical protein